MSPRKAEVPANNKTGNCNLCDKQAIGVANAPSGTRHITNSVTGTAFKPHLAQTGANHNLLLLPHNAVRAPPPTTVTTHLAITATSAHNNLLSKTTLAASRSATTTGAANPSAPTAPSMPLTRSHTNMSIATIISKDPLTRETKKRCAARHATPRSLNRPCVSYLFPNSQGVMTGQICPPAADARRLDMKTWPLRPHLILTLKCQGYAF